MIRELDTQRQRQLAISILAVAIVLLVSVTVLPLWLANASRQNTLDQLQTRLLRYEQVSARDSGLLPRYEELKHAQMSAGNYLKSSTVAVAGAELQRLAKDITATNNAQMISTQILPAANEQGFIRVALRVRLRGPLTAILKSFYDIETNGVFMFLDNVNLRESSARRRPGQIETYPMDAEFELIAYMPDIS
jgi:general secretion pathway protein M